jgi:hypothetical protein
MLVHQASVFRLPRYKREHLYANLSDSIHKVASHASSIAVTKRVVMSDTRPFRLHPNAIRPNHQHLQRMSKTVVEDVGSHSLLYKYMLQAGTNGPNSSASARQRSQYKIFGRAEGFQDLLIGLPRHICTTVSTNSTDSRQCHESSCVRSWLAILDKGDLSKC